MPVINVEQKGYKRKAPYPNAKFRKRARTGKGRSKRRVNNFLSSAARGKQFRTMYGGRRRPAITSVDNSHGLSKSVAMVVMKKKNNLISSIYKKMSNLGTSEVYATDTIQSDWNRQGVYVFAPHFIGGIPTTSNQITSVANDACLKYLNTANSASSSAMLQTNARDYKCFIEGASQTILFTNQAPTSVNFEIYDLVAKVTSDYKDPAAVWEAGADNIEIAGGTFPKIQYPYAKPTISKAFNCAWKIKKVTKVELAAGRSHEHLHMSKINKIVDTEYAYQFGMLKDVTTVTMIVLRGGLGDNQNNRGPGTVGYTVSKLICAYKTAYKMRILQDTPRQLKLASYFTYPEPTSVFVQDEGSGAVTDTKVPTTYA